MIVFVDIDTQNDFMHKDGALYVPDAEEIIPALKRLTEIAKKRKIKIIGSVDRHFGDDTHREIEKELKRWGGPFPDHCMDGTPGQKKIPETTIEDTVFIENRPYPREELKRLVDAHQAIILEKQTYNVFDNPNADEVFSVADTCIVYGVATDYCVRAAVLGLLKRGKKVYLVKDAIKEVSPETGTKAMKEMIENGAIPVTVEWVAQNILK